MQGVEEDQQLDGREGVQQMRIVRLVAAEAAGRRIEAANNNRHSVFANRLPLVLTAPDRPRTRLSRFCAISVSAHLDTTSSRHHLIPEPSLQVDGGIINVRQ
jgi:hypothetical protein